MSDFADIVEEIRCKDERYEKEAYYFIRKGLDYTISKHESQDTAGGMRHVSGQELLAGVRDYALDQYGPLAYTVLTHWGIKCCEDFGEIVFNLVDSGVLGKTEEDKRQDFGKGYEFKEAFLNPFQPDE